MDIDKLKNKESEIQQQLEEWVRTSGLFSPGESVKFTLSLVQSPLVVKDNNLVIWPDAENETGYYRYLSPKMRSHQWDILLKSTLPKKVKRLIESLKANNNRPTLAKRRLSLDSMNREFRNRGLKFQIKRVGYIEVNYQFLPILQLRPVIPKPAVLKHWRRLN